MGQVSIVLHASAAVTSTGNTGAFTIPTLSMASVSVDVTANSGTSEAMGIWLQVSDDDGTTWYDWPADQSLKDDPLDISDQAAVINGRNINGAANIVLAGERHIAKYNHLPAGHCRLRWVISGTVPSFTFAGRLEGK